LLVSLACITIALNIDIIFAITVDLKLKKDINLSCETHYKDNNEDNHERKIRDAKYNILKEKA